MDNTKGDVVRIVAKLKIHIRCPYERVNTLEKKIKNKNPEIYKEKINKHT